MFLDVLEWLYRLKGDDEYRRFALALYDNYNASKVVQDKDAQLVRLLDMQIPLGGHGPDVMGFLRIPLLCYYLSGKPVYREALENGSSRPSAIWALEVHRCPGRAKRSNRRARRRTCPTSSVRLST